MVRLLFTVFSGIVLSHSVSAQTLLFDSAFHHADKGRYQVAGKGVSLADDRLVLSGGRVSPHLDRRGICEKLKLSGEFSFAIWLKPQNLKQEGPARIFTFSKNTSERNFTIGQEGDRYEIRLRTSRTGGNGTPGIQSPKGSATLERTHLVFTRKRDGEARIYLNGAEVAKRRIEGDLANWNRDFSILLGDEKSGGRSWEGTVYSFQAYSGAINPEQVKKLFSGGEIADHTAKVEEHKEVEKNPNEVLFETKVTTLLTNHCLECHDSVTREGDLDLSKKLTSHYEEGVLVKGKAIDSLLWESVEHDDMPHDRPPLNDEEKEVLKQWLDGGAAWTVDYVDPAIYSRPPVVAATESQRLTINEYVRTIEDLFGIDVSSEAREWIPADVRADGFSNTAYNLTVDLEHIEAFSRLASHVAGKIDSVAFAKRYSNKRDLTDKSMIALIEAMGREVLRGPLTGEEKALYRGVSTSVASAGGDFKEAIRYIVEAMLQSPRFLYRIESSPESGKQLLTDYELASRLSYIIWGSAPDRELLQLAGDGNLNYPDRVKAQAARMLKSPRAVQRSLDFANDWLHLDRLAHLQPGKEEFPDWDPAIAAAMRKETLAYFTEVVWKKGLPLASLLNAPFSFVNKPLAKHYGLGAVPVAEGEALVKVDLKDEPARGGILTHGSVLTIGGDEASMVTRGLFVLNDLLRGVIKDPPPCVSTVPVPSEPGKTQRTIALERVASDSCGGCHVKFEPLAFGLEPFDGLGSFHRKDHFGNELREDGEILFPGAEKAVPYDNIGELMDLLAESDRVKETLTWKLVQFCIGRPLNAADAPHVRSIHKQSQAAGGRYTDVLSAIVQSDLVRYAFAGSSFNDVP